MAKKKFGKFLLFSAAIGAVAAGAYYYLQNKDAVSNDELDDDDDFDDFSEDLDSECSDSAERSYVSLDFDTAETYTEESSMEEDTAEDASSEDNTAKEALSNLEKAAESANAEVEEFFDEDDEDLSADE